MNQFLLLGLMNQIRYIPYLPARVYLSERGVYDEAIGYETSLNSSALTIMESIENEQSVSEIIEIISLKYDCTKESAEKDVWDLITVANKRNLVNIRVVSSNPINQVLAALFNVTVHKTQTRYDLYGENLLDILKDVVKVVCGNFIKIGVVMTLLMGLVFFIINSLLNNLYFEYEIIIWLAVYCFLGGCICSFTIHEAMHIYFYRKYSQTNGGYFVTYFLSYSFKRKYHNHYWIILSGIIIPSVIGTAMLFIICLAEPSEFILIGGIMFSIPFVFQLLNLLPFNGDGKALLQLLFRK